MQSGRSVGRTIAEVMVLAMIAGCVSNYSQANADDLDEYRREGVVMTEGQALHYVEAGTPGKPLVVFVHGTPGTWQGFRGYLQDPQLIASLHMIAVDRLGFGASTNTRPPPLFLVQARAISKVFDRNQSGKKVLVVGHSLGGSIGFQLALDNPDTVGALLSVSANVSPHFGKARWYNRLADLPVIKWFVIGDLAIANEEIMPLAGELSAMEPRLRTLAIPVSVIQGSKDKLVSPGNADYVEKTLINARLNVIRPPESGHFILWKQPEIVVAEILRLVGKME